jgi:hypothetical protein
MPSDRWQASLCHNADVPTFGPQKWHTDGPSTALPIGTPSNGLTLFLPLVDLTDANGPTQFLLGSHRGDRGGVAWSEVHDDIRNADAVTLYLPAGSAVAFDLRLWHRGLANGRCSATASTDDRHMLYAIMGRPRYHNGMKLLPYLDISRASLFEPHREVRDNYFLCIKLYSWTIVGKFHSCVPSVTGSTSNILSTGRLS